MTDSFSNEELNVCSEINITEWNNERIESYRAKESHGMAIGELLSTDEQPPLKSKLW